jgi:hypothetical protein
MDAAFDGVIGFFAGLPGDWIAIGAFILIAAFDIMRSGAKRVCTLGLALPAAALVFSALSSAVIIGDIAGQLSSPILQGVLFVLTFVVMYILVGSIGISYGSESGRPLQATLGGIAAAAIVIVIWMGIPVLRDLWSFGPQVQMIFGEAYRFWWLIGSYAALAFSRNVM